MTQNLTEQEKLSLNALVESNKLHLIKMFLSNETRIGQLTDVALFQKRLKEAVTEKVGEISSLIEEFDLKDSEVSFLKIAISCADSYNKIQRYEKNGTDEEILNKIKALNMDELLENPTIKTLESLEEIAAMI